MFVFDGLVSKGGKRGAGFSKWWGLWCRSNAITKGEGIDASNKSFHSFRHAFKRAARMSVAKEEIHDLITGHVEGNVVARGYGKGADIQVLKAAMDTINFPAFPIKRMKTSR